MELIERIDKWLYGPTPTALTLKENVISADKLLQDCKAEIEQLRKERAEVERLLNVLLAGIKGSKK